MMNRSSRLPAALTALAVAGLLIVPTLALGADAHGAAEAAHGAAEAHAEPSLVPSVSTGLVTALTTLVVFVGLLFILTTKAWGPIAQGLEARERKIQGDIAAAETARREAEAALANYRQQIANADSEAREKIATAQRDAEAIAARLKMDAQAEIEESKNRAAREIEESKNAALAEVRQQAASISTAIAGKILKREINEHDQAELVRSSLDELQSNSRR